MNVYQNRKKVGSFKKWRTVKDGSMWAMEMLDGANVLDTENSIIVEPVYRRLLTMDKGGPLIVEIGKVVIGISTKWPFVVVMKGDPDLY